jgi:hypothetical protein
MRTLRRAGLAVSLFTILCAGTASAAMTVYYHAGEWDAFSGPGDDGKPVCGIGITNPTDNRSFSLRFPIGGTNVTFQAKKPTWNIPADTQMPVVIQIGLDTPWNLQGVGNGQVVEWAFDSATMQNFDVQFRRAGSMTVTFPSGNEQPWTVGLSGSTAASNAFGRCVTDLTQRTAGQSPPAVPPADQGPTQPYSQAAAPPPPTATGAPAPQQPVTQEPSQPFAPTGTNPPPPK